MTVTLFSQHDGDALRVGTFCSNGTEVWLRMQGAYDLWHAQRKLAKEIAAIDTGPR